MVLEEYSIARDNKKKAVFAVIFSVISDLLFTIFVLSAIYFVFAATVFVFLSLPVLALSFLFRVLSLKSNVSFDYTLGNGQFIIGKIINNKKRKQIFELFAQDIMRVTVVTEHMRARKDKKTVVCTANDSLPEKKVFVSLETKDKIIIIEASEKLVSILKNKIFN